MAGAWTADKDPANLRCWDQKRRYGQEFLYPVGRYVAGFQNSKVFNNAGVEVKNPLYSDLSPTCVNSGMGCARERDKDLVFVAGVVGVPWQDISVDPADLSKGYFTAAQLTANNVWAKILGVPQDPSNPSTPPVPPTDPHMIASIVPRAGIPGPSSAADADPINGHEWNIAMASPLPNADLQYACVFPILQRSCVQQLDCDCFVRQGGDPSASQNPLCQNSTGQYSNTQTRGKAYPGIRHLEVLKGLGDQAIVGSICPANTTNTSAADFGYRPVIAALIDRMRSPLRGRCLPQQVPLGASGKVPCAVIETYTPPSGTVCNCNDKPGRIPVDPSKLPPEVKQQGSCFCEIAQLDGQDLAACQTQIVPPGTVASGWCYVDPAQAGANASAECALVKGCPANDRRIVRYVNPDSEPRAGAAAYLVCDEGIMPPSGGGTDPCP
jgi:hypothetical protein